MHSETQPASTETVLRIVAGPTRREILRHLQETDKRTVSIDDLAEALEAGERSTGAAEGRTSIELHHSHLPMLADANLIEYNQGRGSIAYRGDDRVENLLEFVSERLD